MSDKNEKWKTMKRHHVARGLGPDHTALIFRLFAELFLVSKTINALR